MIFFSLPTTRPQFKPIASQIVVQRSLNGYIFQPLFQSLVIKNFSSKKMGCGKQSDGFKCL